jgi:D-3-phosphoglycerate dehydrogenase
MKHVLIPTKLDSIAREILEKKKINVVQDGDTPLMDLVKANPETQALIVRSEKVTKEIIDALPKLRLIVRAGAGYNTIDTKYARKAGVDVMNTPGANANAVAEEVLALVLAYFRHVVPADQSTRAGGWEKKKFMGREDSRRRWTGQYRPAGCQAARRI